MKLYKELVAKQHPAITWENSNIQKALAAINNAISVKPHGNDYLISNVPKEGMFPNLPWRTGEAIYGYYNSGSKCEFPTPTGWFFTPQGCLHQHLLERPDEP